MKSHNLCNKIIQPSNQLANLEPWQWIEKNVVCLPLPQSFEISEYFRGGETAIHVQHYRVLGIGISKHLKKMHLGGAGSDCATNRPRNTMLGLAETLFLKCHETRKFHVATNMIQIKTPTSTFFCNMLSLDVSDPNPYNIHDVAYKRRKGYRH